MSVHTPLPPSINCCGAQCQGGSTKICVAGAHLQPALQREPDESQMSALGQEATFVPQNLMSALPRIATVKADLRKKSCPLCSRKRTCAAHQPISASGQKRTCYQFYSIISSARCWRDTGTSRPSVFAVLRLITSSYFVGACTGISLAFSPLRMRST